MLDLTSKLNDKQEEAVLSTKGPVMVMAGAGSGKTRVLTHRIAHLICNEGIYPSEILAVTFTNKAANEMKNRISSLINEDISRMWVNTFHAICAKILRFDIQNLGTFDSKFRILDTDEVVSIIKGIMKDFGTNADELKPKLVASLISNKKNLDNYEYPFHLKSRLVEIEKNYQNKLLKGNLVDFDDLILLTVKLFQNCPEVLEKYQHKFRYILVDEFQDTNTSQYKLIKLLGQRHKNVFVVGDQDQSIYAFRGAVIANVNKFLDDFENCKVILLEENYRSTKQILDLANETILQNSNRIKKNLFSQKSDGKIPLCIQVENQYDEARFVGDKIKELKSKGYKNKEFAIMYRANHLSRLFEDNLIRNQLPFIIYGGMAFYNRMEIKDVVAYISLVCNLDDNYAFLRIVNTPRRRIGESIIDKLNEQSIINSVSLFKAIDFLPTSSFKPIHDFKQMILTLKDQIINSSLDECIDIILKVTDYGPYLASMGEEGLSRIENVFELKNVIIEGQKNFNSENIDLLSSLVNDIALRTNMDDIEENDDKVKLMTYHQAKGLEFKVVFMVAMEEGLFPSSSSYSDFEIEEERRICYVGITRAEEQLYLTYTKTRQVFGQVKHSMISRFIKNSQYLEYENTNPIQANTNMYGSFTNPTIRSSIKPKSNNETLKVNYEQGDKVTHSVFGDGVVVKVNDANISIAFGLPHGIKTINPSIPALKRIDK